MGSPFDLDAFAPPPLRFTLRGRDYTVDGDPDVGTVARMLRIENALDGEDQDTILAAADEASELLLEMVQVREPSVAEFKVSVREILVLFPLIMRGPSVAAAVADALLVLRTNHDGPLSADDRPVATADSGEAGEGDGSPLRSARSSSNRSSSSGSDTGSPAEAVAGSAT